MKTHFAYEARSCDCGDSYCEEDRQIILTLACTLGEDVEHYLHTQKIQNVTCRKCLKTEPYQRAENKNQPKLSEPKLEMSLAEEIQYLKAVIFEKNVAFKEYRESVNEILNKAEWASAYTTRELDAVERFRTAEKRLRLDFEARNRNTPKR